METLDWQLRENGCLFMVRSVSGVVFCALNNFIVSNYFPQLRFDFLHHRAGFELFPRLCNFLRCCTVYHVDIRLHYITVFKFI